MAFGAASVLVTPHSLSIEHIACGDTWISSEGKRVTSAKLLKAAIKGEAIVSNFVVQLEAGARDSMKGVYDFFFRKLTLRYIFKECI